MVIISITFKIKKNHYYHETHLNKGNIGYWDNFCIILVLLKKAELEYRMGNFELSLLTFEKCRRLRGPTEDIEVGCIKSRKAINDVVGGE